MKASFGRLRRLTSHKVDAKDRGELLGTAQIDELARAGKDMQDMRDRYDRLLSAAAATANNVYELSESFGEMGSCLEEIAPHNDEEIGRILVMLSKVQFDLQRVFDTYRSNIFKTITSPSESLLNDLRTVEDMKEQCDEKRNVFESTLVKDKGKPRSSKGERPIPPESRPAYKEFLDEATMCIFRLKSLKEGQARSLLTQAVRHHTAQMHLFHTVMKSLEGVEHHVRTAAEKQHIDCNLSIHGNEVETREDDDDQFTNREGELNFDFRSSEQRMDSTDLSFPRPSATRASAVHADHREEHRMSSYSAPLFPEKKLDLTERLRQTTQAAFPSSNAYVLPTPIDTRYSTFTKPASHASNLRPANHSAGHIWYSSPLEPIKSGKDTETNLYAPLPRRPLTDTHQQRDAADASWVAHKAARQAFSGPLKPSSTKPFTTDTSSGAFCPLPVPPAQAPQPSSSPRVSPTASPPPASSSPRLNELHELPRPPGRLAPPRRTKSPSLVGHSAPLTGWNQERSTVATSTTNIVATPLPVPPLIIPRSFSIPSSNQRAISQRPPERNEDRVASPPLTPMSLMNLRSPSRSRPLPHAPEVAQTNHIRGY